MRLPRAGPAAMKGTISTASVSPRASRRRATGVAGGAVADHRHPEGQPAPEQPQRLDQQVLALLVGREAGRHHDLEARLRPRPGPELRHAAHVHPDVGHEAGAGRERHPELGRPRLDQRLARAARGS